MGHAPWSLNFPDSGRRAIVQAYSNRRAAFILLSYAFDRNHNEKRKDIVPKCKAALAGRLRMPDRLEGRLNSEQATPYIANGQKNHFRRAARPILTNRIGLNGPLGVRTRRSGHEHERPVFPRRPRLPYQLGGCDGLAIGRKGRRSDNAGAMPDRHAPERAWFSQLVWLPGRQ